MGKAAYKQEALPLCKIHVDVFQERFIYIRCNGLHRQLRLHRMDGLLLHIGRIVGRCRLLHQRKLDGFPVIGIPFFLDVSGQLILPVFPEEMEIVAIINDLDVRVLLQEIHVLHCNMGPVQISKVDLILIFHDPVPDPCLVFRPIKDLHAHLLQDRGIRLLMKEIIPQELHHISLLQEHFQILVGGLGTGVLIEGGHIMIHHQDHRLSLAPFPGPERVGISRIDTLLFKLLSPFFPKLPAVLHLVAL